MGNRQLLQQTSAELNEYQHEMGQKVVSLHSSWKSKGICLVQQEPSYAQLSRKESIKSTSDKTTIGNQRLSKTPWLT